MLGSYRGLLQIETGEHGDVVDVTGHLLGAALGGDVLGASKLRAPTVLRKAQQIAGDQRDSPPRALLPRRVGGGVHYHLAHDPPTGMVGVAAGDEEPSERFGHADRPWF